VQKYFVFILPFFLFTFSYSVNKVSVGLKIFPKDSIIKIDGNVIDNKKNKILLVEGKHNVAISAKGFIDKSFEIYPKKNVAIEEKLEKDSPIIKQVVEIKTGSQPKSVRFTPDGRFLLVPLLDDDGVDIIDVNDKKVFKRIVFPVNIAKKKGFVETAISRRNNEFWVSQITTGMVHVIDMNNFELKKSINVKGKYPKVILFNRDETRAFVSNWASNDISIIDTNTYDVIKKIKTYGIPRGIVLSPDEKYLYASLFDKNEIVKIELDTGRIVKHIICGKSMRHLVADYNKGVFFASSMGQGKVYKISFDDKILKENFIGPKINTIALSPDKSILYASSRGPNGKKGYLYKGDKFGKVFVLDADTLEIIEWVYGRNQPTGLDISPDGNILAFSDFLDQNIEFYRINNKFLKIKKD